MKSENKMRNEFFYKTDFEELDSIKFLPHRILILQNDTF